jgi:hypothetical protein
LASSSNARNPLVPALALAEIEIVAFESDFERQRRQLDTEMIMRGLNLFYRVERLTDQECGAPTNFDRALVLIALLRRAVDDERSGR